MRLKHCLAPSGALNTRCDAYGGQPSLRKNYRQCVDGGCSRERSQVVETVEMVRLDVEAREKYPCSACMCEPTRTAPVLSAMTHMWWLHGQSGCQSTDCSLSVVLCVGGWTAWPIDKCSNKEAGRSECKTPTPCGKTQAFPPKRTQVEHII